MGNDFLLERLLREREPLLHKRVKDSVFVLEHMLNAFLVRFPNFTDHSVLHSLDVLRFCNEIIGEERAQKLSAGEIYVIIMAAYLHDIGMGIGEKEYKEFSADEAFAEYFRLHENPDSATVVRTFHNEFSGMFIRKYAGLFDIPSEDLTFAVIQTSRGHRKTDLYDEKEFPDLETEYGTVRTSYTAAIIRLADEIDVASERNPELLFDSSTYTDEGASLAFGSHESIRRVEVTEDAIILHTRPISEEFVHVVDELAEKIQGTLDYCRDVTEKRSDIGITQKDVLEKPSDN